MLITILFCVIALLGGAIVGWLAGSAGKQRAVADAQRRLDEATRARVAAETRLAGLDEDKFVALAQRAFARLGEALVQMNKTQVDGSLDTKKVEIENLLKPLRDMIDQYRGELHKSERSRVEAYGGLQEQIRALLGAQESAQREASRLANALTSPTVRGSWGESSLKRCVELAGMTEFCDFDLQETFAGDDGRRLRPDLIVRLPNNRVIAVDAKMPLSDYQAAADESDDGRKRELLQQHARTLRRHIDSLARRDYHSAVGITLDFTVMFLPGEHFLSAGLVTDPALFEYAVEKKIYLASPTVLLPLLRAVAAGWKAERTEENAKRMHEAGVELFNRFVKVMDFIAEVGGAIGKSVDKYNEMIRSIDTRLWPKGQELQRMSGSGKNLEPLEQIDAVPLESSKLRLTMQQEEPGDVVTMQGTEHRRQGAG
ncbi:MAG TPA: DNA recombination protein RmuC [Thermoanaerobaculia bacterium]|nr:DNA recombination protein RmuC [Thermoanaerobaculia bacterium]